MTVQNSLINGMLQNIPDPKLRETYGAIASGKFSIAVHCQNPQKLSGEKRNAHKKGVLIGYIDLKGRAVEEPISRDDGTVISGIETSRDRFDGRKGFKCYCGNWSIQAPEEQPTFKKAGNPALPPTREGLEEIFAAITKSGKVQGYDFINGSMEYDGFKLEEIKL
jgi:hypothetical protein